MMSVTITLTSEQARILNMYIAMTAYVREEQIKTCENLAQEKNADGAPMFPKMEANAEMWRMIDETVKQVQGILNG